MNDNYMTPDELRRIAELCEALNPLWEVLTTGPKHGIYVETDSVTLNVYDGNGDRLGYISWGDGGPAFYANSDAE